MDKILNILFEAIGTILICLVIIAAGQWFADVMIAFITRLFM